jgi:adenylate kinase
MELQNFIFIGMSGCGKGTQAKLLQEYLKKIDPQRDVFYMQTGAIFRDYIKGDTHTQKISRKIYEEGGLQPEFLSVYMWADTFSKQFKGSEHIIVDGTPRKLHEAGVLHSIFGFYGREAKPHVVFLRITKEWALQKLMARKRIDDNVEDIKRRLSWFDTEVVPAIDYYKNSPHYHFIEVNGEQPIEKVWADLQAGFQF